MDYYNRLLEITGDSKVELATQFSDLLNTELVLGQTRYVCRYGTLSDGHEKFTDAQRYYQALREMYYLSGNFRTCKAQAMEAQADLLDAEEALDAAETPSQKLRAEAKCMLAKERLFGLLVQSQDQMRMLDEYNKVRLELQDKVREQYPLGIEQAEPDNWKTVAEYRMIKGQFSERLDNIPMPPKDKALLGIEYKRNDAIAPLVVANKQLMIETGADQDPSKFLEFMEQATASKPLLEMVK